MCYCNGEKGCADRMQLPWNKGRAERMHKRRVEDAQVPDPAIRFLGGRHRRFDRHRRVVQAAYGEEHTVGAIETGPIGGGRGRPVRSLQRTRHAPPRRDRRGRRHWL